MERQEILEGLDQIQHIARRLQEGTDMPSLDRAMRMVETYCHLMQWELGATDQVLPELEAVD